MRAIALVGEIDEQHRLHAQVPKDLPAGQVCLIVLLPEEQEAGGVWAHGIGKEWVDELREVRQDVYTSDDGHPVNLPW